jgi:ABC-type transport system involved in cytochrome bd biosynthesis fused ATPase/permease subunit
MSISNSLIENNISEENEITKQNMETEVCVSIKDATFAWPNSKIPVLAVDNLKIEEGTFFHIK